MGANTVIRFRRWLASILFAIAEWIDVPLPFTAGTAHDVTFESTIITILPPVECPERPSETIAQPVMVDMPLLSPAAQVYHWRRGDIEEATAGAASK